MKKFFRLILSLCLIFIAVFFAGCNNTEISQNIRTVKIVALGDSISAGFAPKNTDLYEYYYDYITGKAGINEMCFTNLMADQIKSETINVSSKSYAESGDKIDNLV